jgi:hypothetical protein
MSRFGILMVVVTLSAGLAAQTSGPQLRDPADAQNIQPVTPVPWLDPSLANASDRAKMLAISVATLRNCSAGSPAICYGFCAPNPDHANLEQSAIRKPVPTKQLSPTKSKPTDANTGY